jgi:plastocyanin
MSPRTLATVTTMAATAICGAAISTAAALDSAHVASSHAVVLKDDTFRPGTLSIRRGESVTWLWRDGRVVHNVVGHGFQSRVQSQGSFTVRFTHSGTFAYRCTVHPHMTGAIVVH